MSIANYCVQIIDMKQKTRVDNKTRAELLIDDYEIPGIPPYELAIIIERYIYQALNACCTEIESKVFTLTQLGESDKRIAELLNIHRHSVEKYKRNARQKILNSIDINILKIFFKETKRGHFSESKSKVYVSPEIETARRFLEERTGWLTMILPSNDGSFKITIRSNNDTNNTGWNDPKLTQTQLFTLVKTGELKYRNNIIRI